MKCSFRRLIPFLPSFCSCQFRRLDSVQFFCSQAHIPAGWRPDARLSTLCYRLVEKSESSVSFYNPSAGTTQKTQPLLLRRPVLLVRCLAMGVLLLGALTPAGMFLPSRCLAMGIHVHSAVYFSPKNTMIFFYCFMSATYTFSFRVSMFFQGRYFPRTVIIFKSIC
jgi:hypothetical protein